MGHFLEIRVSPLTGLTGEETDVRIAWFSLTFTVMRNPDIPFT